MWWCLYLDFSINKLVYRVKSVQGNVLYKVMKHFYYNRSQHLWSVFICVLLICIGFVAPFWPVKNLPLSKVFLNCSITIHWSHIVPLRVCPITKTLHFVCYVMNLTTCLVSSVGIIASISISRSPLFTKYFCSTYFFRLAKSQPCSLPCFYMPNIFDRK